MNLIKNNIKTHLFKFQCMYIYYYIYNDDNYIYYIVFYGI